MVVLDVLRNGAPEVPLPDRNHPVQTFFFEIITTASCALFPLVEAGVFDAALYYRLNVLLARFLSVSERIARDDLERASPQQPDRYLNITVCVRSYLHDAGQETRE